MEVEGQDGGEGVMAKGSRVFRGAREEGWLWGVYRWESGGKWK